MSDKDTRSEKTTETTSTETTTTHDGEVPDAPPEAEVTVTVPAELARWAESMWDYRREHGAPDDPVHGMDKREYFGMAVREHLWMNYRYPDTVGVDGGRVVPGP